MENPEERYNFLVSIEKLEHLPAEDALAHTGNLIDLAWNLKRTDGLKKALALAEKLIIKKLTSEQLATLHYFMANAWADLKNLTKIEHAKVWDWEQQEMEKEIFHLGSALQSNGFAGLMKERKCQILTNMANALNTIGRFVEAIEYWNRALEILPSFSMAQGNRGYGLAYYARMLYDRGHSAVFLKHAYDDMNTALSGLLYEDAKNGFTQTISWIQSKVSSDYLKEGIDMDSFSLGDSNQEIQYRRWCLENRLFINPLNDLGSFSIACQDILTTPDIVIKVGEGPYYQGYFNQIKQEYVSVRYLYYEGIKAKETHFSDKRVLLYNTLDYPSYSIAVEKVKVTFRICYSLFDKIAYFLNHYLKLVIPEKNVTFRTFWYSSQKRKNGLRAEFQYSPNWPLRGLFWLSKDLYEDRAGLKEVINPDAKDLWEIRNHMEHKYLKLHEMFCPGPPDEEGKFSPLADKLAYSISRSEFEQKTLRLLKMTRAALIYLSLGIHCEEKRRAQKRDTANHIPRMFLDVWEDEWKV
jgi:tetratricopeptide (TPR) repeat protein